jgi:hypothetical protein
MDKHIAEIGVQSSHPGGPQFAISASRRAANSAGIFSPSFAAPVILLSRVRARSKAARRMFIGSAATPMMTP